MKKFIFVTPEGNTESPNGKEIENLQVIGFAEGIDEVEAIKNLLKENLWIWDSGFNVAEFIGYELA
jgi:hypothetical protein